MNDILTGGAVQGGAKRGRAKRGRAKWGRAKRGRAKWDSSCFIITYIHYMITTNKYAK